MPDKGRMTGEKERKCSGEMTVREAGHRGGEKVRDLIEKGEEMEGKRGQKRTAESSLRHGGRRGAPTTTDPEPWKEVIT